MKFQKGNRNGPKDAKRRLGVRKTNKNNTSKGSSSFSKSWTSPKNGQAEQSANKNKKINKRSFKKKSKKIFRELSVSFLGSGANNCRPALMEILKSSKNVGRPKNFQVIFNSSDVENNLLLLNKIEVDGKKLLVKEMKYSRQRDPLRRLVRIENRSINAEEVKKVFAAESIEKMKSLKANSLYILTFKNEEAANKADKRNVKINSTLLKLQDFLSVQPTEVPLTTAPTSEKKTKLSSKK